MKVRIYFTEEPASTNWTEIINLPTAIDIQDAMVDGESFYLKAKKEVFDDIEKIVFNPKDKDAYIGHKFSGKLLQDLKKRHLSTFAEQKQHNSSSKKDCTDCNNGSDGVPDCVIDGECPDKIKRSPS